MIAVSESLPPADTTADSSALAPWVHTLFLLGVLLLWAIYGAFRFHLPVNAMPHMVTYVSGIIVQYLLVGSTIAGLYHRRQVIRNVLGFWSLRAALRDFGIGILVFICGLILIAVIGIAVYLTPLHSTFQREVVKNLLPQSQGGGAVLQLSALGALYGTVAARRGTLRSIMVAHALQDITVAFIYYLKTHL
jgi:hypothetical protein